MLLKDKNILVGVSASISAYKSPELVRAIQKEGGKVRVILTPKAKNFIGELTFKALTEDDVLSDWNDGKTGLEHIYWARWSDGFVIAPCSANLIGKLRVGLADNFLTSLALAYDKNIVLAPAMNTKMLKNPATQENIKVLKDRGYIFVDTKSGELACHEIGEGKLADIEDILTQVMYAVYPKPLKNKKILITAGGTREYFDPIRYISNNSSGLMGYLFAKVCYILGGEVILISAPTYLKKPYGVKVIDVISASDMYNAVMKHLEKTDIVIMNSAVADFRPKDYSKSKLKKSKEEPVVYLEANPDILKEVGKRRKDNQILLGFAAESDNLEENALSKLKRKNLDMIVANPLTVFSKDKHTGVIIFKSGERINLPILPKDEAVLFIINKLIEKFISKDLNYKY